MQETANRWECIGNTDLFMIFQWLREEISVKEILEVVVDDMGGEDKRPHSDQAIIECLGTFKIETWAWRRMDIPSDVIIKGSGGLVKKLYLCCSGLRAVLQSWCGKDGLARLQHVS